MKKPKDVLDFWFALSDKMLFKADPKFDEKLRRRFGSTFGAARDGELDTWEDTPEGALALVLLLDQMSRNILRGTPAMYEQDAKARGVANRAIARGDDRRFSKNKRRWFYMPFMHSEDFTDQKRCIELCLASDLKRTLPHARKHAEIVRLFGRFPHRNAILGRRTTEAEKEYLESGGFSG